MVTKIILAIKSVFDKYALTLSFFTVILVLSLDYFTGERIQFPIFYALPVGMLAWKNYKITSYTTAIFMASARIFFHILWKDEIFLLNIISNAFITSFALALYAFFLNRISEQNEYLKKSVYMLEGILPMCSVCKKIRDEDGSYQKVDEFIANHSQAQFSNSLCPECAKEFYPNYFKEKMKFKMKESYKDDSNETDRHHENR